MKQRAPLSRAASNDSEEAAARKINHYYEATGSNLRVKKHPITGKYHLYDQDTLLPVAMDIERFADRLGVIPEKELMRRINIVLKSQSYQFKLKKGGLFDIVEADHYLLDTYTGKTMAVDIERLGRKLGVINKLDHIG